MKAGRIRRKLIKHEESRYTIPQAKRHLKHHRGVKLLAKQISGAKERKPEASEK